MDNYMNVEQFIKNCEEREVQLLKMVETTKQSIQKLDEMNEGKVRRVYSLNVASYLSMKGYYYTVHEDEVKTGLRYFYFKDDCSKELEEYKSNTELQNFIRAYAEIRQKLHS